MEPSVRPLRDGDAPSLYAVCLRTADAGADASASYRDPDLPGHVWLGAYLRFEPDLVRVVDDGGGGAVGYVVGACDTDAFATQCEEEWWPALRSRYPDPTGPREEWTADGRSAHHIHHPPVTDPGLVASYPSHLHIDLLPEAQGHGLGRTLIGWLCDELRRRGSPGVHLGVHPRNTGAQAFYEAIGFARVPDVDGFWFARRL